MNQAAISSICNRRYSRTTSSLELQDFGHQVVKSRRNKRADCSWTSRDIVSPARIYINSFGQWPSITRPEPLGTRQLTAQDRLQRQLEASVNWSIRVQVIILNEVRQSDFSRDINVGSQSDPGSVREVGVTLQTNPKDGSLGREVCSNLRLLGSKTKGTTQSRRESRFARAIHTLAGSRYGRNIRSAK